MRRPRDIKISLLAIVAFTVVIWLLMIIFPELAEMFYGRWVFGFIRHVYDHTFGYLPFPMIYLVLVLILLLTGWFFSQANTWKLRLSAFCQLLAFLFILFFWSWGYNYQRPPVKEKLKLSIPEVNVEEVMELYCRLTDSLPIWREALDLYRADSLESLVRNEAQLFFDYCGLPAPGRPRIRQLGPPGILLGMSTAGIYIPHAFEAHVDKGLHDLSLPYIMAHEVSHAFGITDEGECNFLAALICRNSTHAYLSYSGGLYELQRVYAALYRSGIVAEQLRSEIDSVILEDLRQIRFKHDSYPTYFPEGLRNLIYDTYLRSQGIKSGLASYGEVLGLLISWEHRQALKD